MIDDTAHIYTLSSGDEASQARHLTRTQKKLLDEIEESIRLNGYAPSYRELMTRFGYKSLGAVHRLIRELQKKGHLARPSKRTWRSICLTQENSERNKSDKESRKSSSFRDEPETVLNQGHEVEIIGTVSGNKAPELFLQPKPLSLPLLPHAEKASHPLFYGLLIQDTSFTNEHLLPGDIIIVEPTEDIMPGELVLATTDKESIIGHFFDEGDVVRFKPSPYSHTSSFFQSKKAASQHTQVWGIIIASLRGFSSLL